MAEKRMNTAELVNSLAEPLAKELGLEIWDVNFVKEGADWFLRVFIDKEGGVNIDDCVDMSHALSPVLDSEDPIPQEYTLEVSSPGIGRKLTKKAHFEKFLEWPVRVKLIRPTEDGRREIDGVLSDIDENGDFEIVTEDESMVCFTKKECSSITLLDDFED